MHNEREMGLCCGGGVSTPNMSDQKVEEELSIDGLKPND